MDTVLDRTWTTEAFLAWDDQQEGKHEFDGRRVIPMTGGSFAHQDIVYNLRGVLGQLLADRPFRVGQAMRLRIGARVRYPDVLVCAGPLDQNTRTVTDAVVIFEVLSDDTASTDRVDELLEYAEVPSRRTYVLVEQTKTAATVFDRAADGLWSAAAYTDGALPLAGLHISLPLAELYRGLTFPE